MNFSGSAQDIPGPAPVSQKMEQQLLKQLDQVGGGRQAIQVNLQLCNLYYNKPYKRSKDLNKAMSFAKKALAMSERSKYASGINDGKFWMAYIFLQQDSLQKAELILPALKDQSKLDLLLALGYFYRASPGRHAENYPKVLEYDLKAKKLAVQLKQPVKEIMAMKEMAILNADQQKPNAELELLEIIKRYKAIGFKDLQYTYFELAGYETVRGDFVKALKYAQLAVNYLKNDVNAPGAGDIYFMYGTVLSILHEDQRAIDFFKLSLKGYAQHAGQFNIYTVTVSMCFDYGKLKKYTEMANTLQDITKNAPPEKLVDIQNFNVSAAIVYLKNKDYKRAARHYLIAIAAGDKYHIDDPTCYTGLGQVYTESGQYEKARPYLNRYLKFPAGSTAFSQRAYVHYWLYQVDSAAGNFKSAMWHLRQNHGLQDSSLTKSKAREIQKLQVEFDVKAKEANLKLQRKDIALLRDKEKMQQSKLDQANYTKNITIAGIALLIVVSVTLYFLYETKRRLSEVSTEKNAVITSQNLELQQLLSEKDWLIKEVHHRVKNNLQIVMSLLASQAAYLKDEHLSAIENSQHRIYAMSLIHKKLYQSVDVKTIQMDKFLLEFVQYLRDSFGNSDRLHFEFDVAPIELGVTQAIPLALIVNEAVTNSLKYAFPNELASGTISISLRTYKATIELLIADNGIGMPAEQEEEVSSFGLELMRGLSKEIHGNLVIAGTNGTAITITFRKTTVFDPSLV